MKTCFAVMGLLILLVACAKGPNVTDGYNEKIEGYWRLDEAKSLVPSAWGIAVPVSERPVFHFTQGKMLELNRAASRDARQAVWVEKFAYRFGETSLVLWDPNNLSDRRRYTVSRLDGQKLVLSGISETLANPRTGDVHWPNFTSLDYTRLSAEALDTLILAISR